MEANYVGYTTFRRTTTGTFNNPIFNYFYDNGTDYRNGDAPTVGVAATSETLTAPIPMALAGTSADGSQSVSYTHLRAHET